MMSGSAWPDLGGSIADIIISLAYTTVLHYSGSE